MRTDPPEWLYRRTRFFNILHLLRLTGPHSQMIEDEKRCLQKYAQKKSKALEIGTYMGVSASIIAKSLVEGGVVYCVDPYTGLDVCQEIAERELKRNKVFEKTKLFKGFSSDEAIIKQIPTDLDFILVDGDHSYEGLKNDWKIVSERLVSNGIVCLHDTITPEKEPWRNFGSVEYFNKIIMNDPGFELLESVFSMNVLRRK
ncbi:MAG: class I SAM-dependent methyltransferase [Ferruginibacter sp.]